MKLSVRVLGVEFERSPVSRTGLGKRKVVQNNEIESSRTVIMNLLYSFYGFTDHKTPKERKVERKKRG